MIHTCLFKKEGGKHKVDTNIVVKIQNKNFQTQSQSVELFCFCLIFLKLFLYCFLFGFFNFPYALFIITMRSGEKKNNNH